MYLWKNFSKIESVGGGSRGRYCLQTRPNVLTSHPDTAQIYLDSFTSASAYSFVAI